MKRIAKYNSTEYEVRVESMCVYPRLQDLQKVIQSFVEIVECCIKDADEDMGLVGDEISFNIFQRVDCMNIICDMFCVETDAREEIYKTMLCHIYDDIITALHKELYGKNSFDSEEYGKDLYIWDWMNHCCTKEHLQEFIEDLQVYYIINPDSFKTE